MSFVVEWPDGGRAYINGQNQSAFMTYNQMEKKAVDMAARVGGVAYRENGGPRFQKDGVDLFARWVEVGTDISPQEKALRETTRAVKTTLASQGSKT